MTYKKLQEAAAVKQKLAEAQDFRVVAGSRRSDFECPAILRVHKSEYRSTKF